MEKSVPKVSIGLAVFNGENYIREAIDSILAQTFTDFELIISDNASTDRTKEICKEYESKDSRTEYYRNPSNTQGELQGEWLDPDQGLVMAGVLQGVVVDARLLRPFRMMQRYT
jgi:cellulose synthase/poly-beta-1,6-N-acetylglucosamine synthase-like glycosyltransferase